MKKEKMVFLALISNKTQKKGSGLSSSKAKEINV